MALANPKSNPPTRFLLYSEVKQYKEHERRMSKNLGILSSPPPLLGLFAVLEVLQDEKRHKEKGQE